VTETPTSVVILTMPIVTTIGTGLAGTTTVATEARHAGGGTITSEWTA
jgi:hypothetical protein